MQSLLIAVNCYCDYVERAGDRHLMQCLCNLSLKELVEWCPGVVTADGPRFLFFETFAKEL